MSHYILGDINHNGYVDYCDMFVLGDAYIHGTTPEDPRWNGHADLNNDRRIDYLDVFLFGVAYVGRAFVSFNISLSCSNCKHR
jgi:hypothetical protein